MRTVLLLFGLVLVPGAPATAAEAAGPEALAPFKRDLMGALKAGLAESTVAGVETCHLVAPNLPAAQADRGYEVGRASDRLRNPDNTAPAWAAPTLARMFSGELAAAPRYVPTDDGRTGYVEPIRVGPPCLQCHGEELAPEVAAAIDARYPDDRARGYALGDLRGFFWIVPEETTDARGAGP